MGVNLPVFINKSLYNGGMKITGSCCKLPDILHPAELCIMATGDVSFISDPLKNADHLNERTMLN